MPDPLPFGSSLCALTGQISTFGLSPITTFISGSHMLTILRHPSPRPPRCWQSQRPLAVSLPSLANRDEGYTCPRSFTPHRYQ
jgi:hypothetical protein